MIAAHSTETGDQAEPTDTAVILSRLNDLSNRFVSGIVAKALDDGFSASEICDGLCLSASACIRAFHPGTADERQKHLVDVIMAASRMIESQTAAKH